MWRHVRRFVTTYETHYTATLRASSLCLSQRSRAAIATMSTTTATHHKIVALETLFVPLPRKFSMPEGHTYEVVEYARTKPSEVPERIRDADIIVMTILPLSAEHLSAAVAPRLKMVSVVASGTDSVNLPACRERGIHVANSPHCNEGAVAEHVIALYFSARRFVPLVNSLTRAGEWPRQGTLLKTLNGPHGKPPMLCSSEVMGIIGYGSVGKKVESIAKALGMEVLISGRKGQKASEGRTDFETVIKGSSVLVLCLPRSPETLNTISEAELDAMPRYSILVNVSRGGIVDEEALVRALKAKKIAGAATDVFLNEPASPESCPLLAPGTEELNLVTTPHVAWCAEDTIYNYNETLKKNILTWLEGRPTNLVV
jgi:lactate dehydrogenase-like 2-hydroxyacid dehydrogenase